MEQITQGTDTKDPFFPFSPHLLSFPPHTDILDNELLLCLSAQEQL